MNRVCSMCTESHQGSTKVFKARPDRRLSSHASQLADAGLTVQKMDVAVDRDAAFFLLPVSLLVSLRFLLKSEKTEGKRKEE